MGNTNCSKCCKGDITKEEVDLKAPVILTLEFLPSKSLKRDPPNRAQGLPLPNDDFEHKPSKFSLHLNPALGDL